MSPKITFHPYQTKRVNWAINHHICIGKGQTLTFIPNITGRLQTRDPNSTTEIPDFGNKN